MSLPIFIFCILALILLFVIELFPDIIAPHVTLKNVKISEQIIDNFTKTIQVSVVKSKDGNFTELEYIKGHGFLGIPDYDTIFGTLINKTINPMDIVLVTSQEKNTDCKYLIKTKDGFQNNTESMLLMGSYLLGHVNFTSDSYLDCGDKTINTFKVIKP